MRLTTLALLFCLSPHAFATAGDLQVMCENKAGDFVMDVRKIGDEMIASLNYKETPNAAEHVGTQFYVRATDEDDNGLVKYGTYWPVDGAYCNPPTLPVRRFTLTLNGASSQVHMTLGYNRPEFVESVSCWGILKGANLTRP